GDDRIAAADVVRREGDAGRCPLLGLELARRADDADRQRAAGGKLERLRYELVGVVLPLRSDLRLVLPLLDEREHARPRIRPHLRVRQGPLARAFMACALLR